MDGDKAMNGLKFWYDFKKAVNPDWIIDKGQINDFDGFMVIEEG